jgi:hypothetical protein
MENLGILADVLVIVIAILIADWIKRKLFGWQS